jgi:hypothetical protein
MKERIKFASQAEPELLDAIKKVAQEEGRQFQSVLEEAMVYYLENRKHKKIRSSVLSHFHDSVTKNRRLGELLAR